MVSVKLKVDGTANETLKFEIRKRVGNFGITKDKTYFANAVIPKLIAKEKHVKIKGKMVVSFETYHQLKQKFFKQWMTETQFFEEVENDRIVKPHFITSTSCMYMPLMTPGNTFKTKIVKNWEIYAMKDDDIIYLWSDLKGADKFAAANPTEYYYGVYFEHLLTHEDAAKSAPNQFEKVFVINDIKFGVHNLICLSDVDAQSNPREYVEIKVYKEHSSQGQAQNLKTWAQSTVSGVQQLVIGKRDDKGNVCSIGFNTTDKLGKQLPCSTGSCYDFQDRLLTWIKQHLQENARTIKKFSWHDHHNSHVYCSDVRGEKVPLLLFAKSEIDTSGASNNEQSKKRKAAESTKAIKPGKKQAK